MATLTAPAPLAGGPISCPANIQETRIAFGYKPQTDVPTINALADMWALTKVNPALSVVNPVNETNALDIGKGNEFPSQTFPSHQDTSVALEKYVSSEFLAWLFCFTTGQATKTVAGTGFAYAAVPNDPAVTCINLPCFTWDEQIRPSPNSVVDRALIGCVVGDWALTMSSGPGRANCRVACTLPGSGRVQSPGLSPLPALTPEHFLNASGAFITINGIDYVLQQTFMSLEFRYNNNVRLDTGLYPGSGTQNGFGVRGRMEYGVREMSLNFVARAQKGSIEYNNLINQVEGPVSFGVKGALIDTTFYHNFTISMPRTIMQAVVNGDDANIVTVQCGVTALQPTDGITPIITMSATTTKDGILGL
ncbi:MAG TPA: phage tail tube protein [Burkholderiales bacterium]|nr:phage tail tube protein [Burkholderiales bacterium]